MIFLVLGVREPRIQDCSFWFITMWNSAREFRWRALEVLWESSGVEISHCTSNWLFHRHRGRTFQSFPTPPCTLVGFKKFQLYFSTQAWCSSCWCKIGHKGAPECHRFCPGTFLHVQIPINRDQETLALPEHSSYQAYLTEALPWWLES